ncbi:unnamed protein product [Symbiodinium sp. KB8]|nr:unnamed protein product [Symbiodinium sp. KB8]
MIADGAVVVGIPQEAETSMTCVCSVIEALQSLCSWRDIQSFLTECSGLFMLARSCFKEADAASGDFPVPSQLPELHLYRALQSAKPGVPMIKLLDSWSVERQGLMFGRFVVVVQFLQVLLPHAVDGSHLLSYLVVEDW